MRKLASNQHSVPEDWHPAKRTREKVGKSCGEVFSLLVWLLLPNSQKLPEWNQAWNEEFSSRAAPQEETWTLKGTVVGNGKAAALNTLVNRGKEERWLLLIFLWLLTVTGGHRPADSHRRSGDIHMCSADNHRKSTDTPGFRIETLGGGAGLHRICYVQFSLGLHNLWKAIS